MQALMLFTPRTRLNHGGREEDAIRELMRCRSRAQWFDRTDLTTANKEDSIPYVPSWLRARTQRNCDVWGRRLPTIVLARHINNPLNPSGLLLIEKSELMKRRGRPSLALPATHISMSDLGMCLS